MLNLQEGFETHVHVCIDVCQCLAIMACLPVLVLLDLGGPLVMILAQSILIVYLPGLQLHKARRFCQYTHAYAMHMPPCCDCCRPLC